MFSVMENAGVSDLHFKCDKTSGLKAIVGIHNTGRGPALGGCRFIHYNDSDEAITDAVRLARGMSFKAALAGLEQGGGKSVIMMPSGHFDRERLFKTFGQFINELGGRYIAAMDSGTTVADMDAIAAVSPHVTCTSQHGSPAPYTAHGVYLGIRSCLKFCPDLPEKLAGVHVAVQGLGNVGWELCERLHRDGAQLTVTDIDSALMEQAVQAFSAECVLPDDIYNVACDIFSPCGLGAIINRDTVQKLNCRIVAGSANNQLVTPEMGLGLHRQGILYAPDFIINAGGLIYVSLAHAGKSHSEIEQRIAGIEQTLGQLFLRQEQSGEPVSLITDRMAEDVLYREAATLEHVAAKVAKVAKG